MTAPRLREQRRPPSPPDRRPPRLGGPPSSQTASAAGRRAGFPRLAGARRGLLRSRRALAAAALLALVGGVDLPAQAQTVTTLLSNLEQVWTEGNGTNVSSAIVFAQGFTTGSNADGYHLSSIELNVERVPNTPADVTIALWSATSDSRPDASVATLTHSTGTWTTGLNTFDAPAGTELDTGTTYFVYTSYSGSGLGLNLSYTNSTSADAGGAPDWSVGQVFRSISGGDWATSGGAFRFSINGTAEGGMTPPLSTAATNAALPPPQDVNAEPLLPGEIRLSWWRTPDDASHDLVDRHQYRYRVRDASTWTVDWTTVNQTALPGTTETRNYNSVLLKGLTARTTYEFQVRSVDKGGRYSEAVSALGTAVGGQTVWIEAPSRSVEEGEPLRFTLSRDQPHGRLMVILRTSETGDMLPPEGRTPEGYWHEQVHFGDGNATISVVRDTVNDRGGPEPNSAVTVEVMPYPLYPDNPDNEPLYEVLPDLRAATRTVTAAVAPTCTLNPGDRWCGVITVGDLSVASGGAYGYNVLRQVGYLSDTDFDVGTNSYTVLIISVAKQGQEGSGALTFFIDPRPGTADMAELAQLALHLDNDAFKLGEVPQHRPGSYYWSAESGTNLNWSEEDYVIARLREASGGSSHGGEAEPLTAAFEGLPEAHDGETAFSFRVAFSEAVTVTPEAMRTRVLTVAGGAVTGAARVDGESGVWAITVTPDTREALSIALAPAAECEADGAVCTADGRALSIGVAHIVSGPGPETETPQEPALTASFEGLPEAHDGETAFRVRVAFSEDIGISYVTLRDESFSVTDGDVTGARRVDGRHDLWEITVESESREAVTISLPGGRACGTAGAVCTRGDDPRPLSNSPSATVAGPAEDPAVTNTAATGAPTISGTAQVDETLTASVSGISDADGLDNASYEYQWIRGNTDIQDATDSSYTLVSVDEGETITVRVTFSDDKGHEESLTSAATDAVAPASAPLTATFTDVPAEHAGAGETFTFGLTFSEHVAGLSYKTLRDAAFSVTNGQITRARRRTKGSNQGWTITVKPDSSGAVTIRLPATTDCDASGAICTADDRGLSHSLSARVADPVGISVADARVEEGADAVLAFAVTLSRAASVTLTVDYATSDGTATAGEDYTATSGTLTFEAGESSKTIEVTVLDDFHDEGEETLTLRLSNPSGGRVTDGEATGTIENRDPLPKALLARFGRAAAVHVVEQVQERIEAQREVGIEAQFAGRQLRPGMEREMAVEFLSRLAPSLGANRVGAGVPHPMSVSPVAGSGSLGTPGSGRRGADGHCG